MKKVYLIATFVAIVAGIATYLFASQLSKSQKIENIQMSTVVVALVDIKENSILAAEMFEIKTYTSVSVVPDAAIRVEDVVGKLNRYPITKGEQIVAKKLVTIGEKADNAALSYQLLPGEYAFSLPLDGVQGVSGFITRGDYVDVLFTSDVADATYNTDIILRDVYVLRVGNNAANRAAEVPNGAPITAYVEIVVKLNEEQIISLSNYLAKGPVRLALKPLVSGEITTPAAQ